MAIPTDKDIRTVKYNGVPIPLVGGDDIFIATYNVTTYQEVDDALKAGKLCICKWDFEDIGARWGYFCTQVSILGMINFTSTQDSGRVDVWTLSDNDSWDYEITDYYQKSTIADTEQYFTKNTVEGALSELGKAVFDPDYDMVIEINGDPDGNMTQSSSYHSSITQGSVANILDKLENDPSHVVKILVKWKIYYGTALNVRNEVLYPWVEYFSSGTWVEMLSTWSWWNAKLKVSISPSGQIVVYPSFG